MSSVLPSIRQQPNETGEEHKQAYASEGESYSGGETDRQVTHNSTTGNLITSNNISVKDKEQKGWIPHFNFYLNNLYFLLVFKYNLDPKI